MPFGPLPARANEAGAIVRVLRATLSTDEYATFEPTFDAYVGRTADRWSANFALWWGAARMRGRTEVAVVSGWESVRALRRARAGLSDTSLRDEPVAAFERAGSGEVWRLVDQTATTYEPAAGRVLRLLRLPVDRDSVSAFIDLWMPLRSAFVDAGDLAVSQLALREGRRGPTILLVNVWRDSSSISRVGAGEPEFLATQPGALLRSSIRTETYDLHPTSILRLAPGGPAILITDDAGRVVDVTPAASALLGAGAWDLIDRRLDDIADLDGSGAPRTLSGRYRFRRPEGGAILLQARGAPHVPAPGRNAILLVPGSQPTPSDADVEGAIGAAYRREAPVRRPVSHEGEAERGLSI